MLELLSDCVDQILYAYLLQVRIAIFVTKLDRHVLREEGFRFEHITYQYSSQSQKQDRMN